MSFERPADASGRETPAEDRVPRPTHCPECRSKSFGTLAKVVTVDTYWRCQACGMVWNEARCQASAPQRRW